MDEWIKEMFRDTSAIGGTFAFWDVLLALSLSLFLSLSIVWVYKQTHSGLSYSVSFVHTIVIMSVTVSVTALRRMACDRSHYEQLRASVEVAREDFLAHPEWDKLVEIYAGFA